MSNVVLLLFGERLPPLTELPSELDFPSHNPLCHKRNILSTACWRWPGAIVSLQEYLLVASDRMHVDLYTRQADGRWLLTSANRLEDTLDLESVNCRLSLAELYEKVDLEGAQGVRAAARLHLGSRPDVTVQPLFLGLPPSFPFALEAAFLALLLDRPPV